MRARANGNPATRLSPNQPSPKIGRANYSAVGKFGFVRRRGNGLNPRRLFFLLFGSDVRWFVARRHRDVQVFAPGGEFGLKRFCLLRILRREIIFFAEVSSQIVVFKMICVLEKFHQLPITGSNHANWFRAPLVRACEISEVWLVKEFPPPTQ